MHFSLIQAAKHIGVSKSTMHRYIKSGRVSAARLDDGGYQIDASELSRAFPPDRQRRGAAGPASSDRASTAPVDPLRGGAVEVLVLQAEVRLLRELLDRVTLDRDRERSTASDAIDDLRRRLDREGEERRALNARLLTYAPAPPVAPVPAAANAPNDPSPSG